MVGVHVSNDPRQRRLRCDRGLALGVKRRRPTQLHPARAADGSGCSRQTRGVETNRRIDVVRAVGVGGQVMRSRRPHVPLVDLVSSSRARQTRPLRVGSAASCTGSVTSSSPAALQRVSGVLAIMLTKTRVAPVVREAELAPTVRVSPADRRRSCSSGSARLPATSVRQALGMRRLRVWGLTPGGVRGALPPSLAAGTLWP